MFANCYARLSWNSTTTPTTTPTSNGHPLDDPREDVGEDVGVGVRVRVGVVECQLYFTLLTKSAAAAKNMNTVVDRIESY